MSNVEKEFNKRPLKYLINTNKGTGIEYCKVKSETPSDLGLNLHSTRKSSARKGNQYIES